MLFFIARKDLSIFLLLRSVIVIVMLLSIAGCGCKKEQKDHIIKKTEVSSFEGKFGEKPSNDKATTISETQISQDPAYLNFQREKKHFAEVTKNLEDAYNMIKSGNLEGALRIVQRIQQENPNDHYIGMQTNYMKAMIYHRQKAHDKRKEAMTGLLNSMEKLQQDPRFRRSFEEGKACVEVIKESLKNPRKNLGK